MNVVIVGGGEIGAQIAGSLQRSHSVVVIDQDEERGTSFETMDVLFVRGNGADPADLRSAGADEADAFIACTSNDDVNVLSCLAAKGLGATETMAFVTRQRYVEAFKHHGAMESIGLVIDRILWPQRTLATQIVDIIRVPRALDTATFAGGRIKMIEYKMEEGDPCIGVPLAECDLPDSVLVVGSIREDSFIIPSGRTVLCPEDKVVFMGTTQSMRRLEGMFAPRKRVMNVVIIGGGNVGFMVAEELQHDRAKITIIEQDEPRTEKLAQWLPRVLVLRGDGTDLELLEQERIEDNDVLVAVTDDDGKNLLASLLAKQLGIPKVITRVGRTRNRRLFERVGVESPLTPKNSAIQEVLNWLHLDEVEHLASIEDRAEVMELVYPGECEEGQVQDLGAPPKSLIGAILRDGEVIVPRGNTKIKHDDHLFIVTTPDNIGAVESWLEDKKTE